MGAVVSNIAAASSPATADSALVCLYGQGVAKGYAIGRAVVLGATSLEVAHYRIAPADVPAECRRLTDALAAAQADLSHLGDSLSEDAPLEMAALLNVHRLLLADPLLTEQTLALIAERHYNAEWALAAQGQMLAEQFAAMEDEYLRERGADVRQVIERVLHVLSGAANPLSPLYTTPLEKGEDDLIVVARDISPADMLKLRDAHFGAFLTDLGGPTSHTAIVARSMNVPAVVGLGNVRTLVRDGDVLIVDGMTGAVIVNPPPFVLQEYHERLAAYVHEREALGRLRDVDAVTLDGVKITLQANIELPEEVNAARQAGAQGIGLFRSEFLFMGRDGGLANLPSEDEQYAAYAHVVRGMPDHPVTIRTLDLGADKTLDGDVTVAANPALGLRAIRYCLAHPDLFATQLRALLRAAVHGKVRILIPMISHMHEVHAVRQALAAAREALEARGVEYGEIELGAMVEIPAVAIAIEPFIQELDFLSIGTNDLIQYTLAIDRGDNEVVDLYDPMHPAVLRLISATINAGERAGKPVSVCGEMAGDAQLTRMLLGLGLTSFSMHPQQLLDVKREICQAHSMALRKQVAAALNRAERPDLQALQSQP